MNIDALRGLGAIDPQQAYGTAAPGAVPRSFADTLRQAIADVDTLQVKRDDLVEQMASGAVTEAHDVMIAAEEAQMAFELLLEVRNRLLESYQEVMRMQV
jgi:flagellar hook-basal body complex protein FliE